MRLLSITARNYRLHRDLTVDFDPARNLIGGSNDTGKSTLAEAMHRALFFRHRSGGAVQASMKSDIHNGQPEVKLVFETGGRTWTLDKRFSGPSGTVRLSSNDGSNLQGDAAEEKLAQLVGNPDGTSTTFRELSSQWAHLWVWQGSSGDNATVHTASHKDELVQRLQQQGLAAVLQSETDEQVRESLRGSYDEMFTRTGVVKAGSKLDTCNKTLADATAELARAVDQKQRLESAIADQESAAKILADSAAALPGLRVQLNDIRQALAQVNDLRAREELETNRHRSATAAREQLAKVDLQIQSLRKQAADARESLLPTEAKISILADQETAARDTANAADLSHRSTAEKVREARQQQDLASACVSHFEKSAAFDSLSNQAKEAATISDSLASERDALSKLPAITTAQLESLRKLDGKFRLAEGALQAIAAGVELIASDQPVQLDGKALTAGDSRVITEVAELTLGTGMRLRIQPGGGTSLAESRQKLDELREQLSRTLDQLTVRDLAEAAEVVAKRQAIEQRIGNLETQLQALGANDLSAALTAATSARSTAAAEVDRRKAAVAGSLEKPLPDSLEAARALLALTLETLEQAELKESGLRADADALRSSHQKIAQTLQAHRESIENARSKLQQLEISANVLEQNHGDSATRRQALEAAVAAEQSAKTELDATTKALADLKPESLNADQTRLTRVIEQQLENQRDAETRIAVARNTLALDGTTDPDADLLRAKARLSTIGEEQAREDRRAKAIALLHRLFSESQAAIGESVTQPIAERVAGYLECLFGRGVQVRVDLSEPNRPSLQLTRPGTPAFSFDSLSGGAKEQVAAAVRLAMAEILAASHDGCLPLVFDDAFAYADPERVQALQRMLDLAASRGLQVIVLTCTPADYIGLGAREIRLTPQLGNPSLGSPVSTETSSPDETTYLPPSGDPEAAFLTALRSRGGSAGNQSLRTALGWDEATYLTTKDALIDRGLILPGKGRGGSVSLAEPTSDS